MTATSTLYPTTVAGTTGSTWTTTSNATGSGTGTTSAAWAVFTNAASGGTGTISLSGYAAQTPVTSGSTIDSVVLSLRGNVAATARWTAASCTAQLFSGTTAIGTPVAVGTLSTSTSNVWTISFTGANAPSYAQLSDLRVTVTAVHSGTTSSTFNVDTAGLVVNYTAPSKIATLTDDFATADPAKWSFGATATVTGGQLSLGVNSGYSGSVGSVAAYDLTGSSATAQLVQAANPGNGTTETVFYLYTTPGNVNDNAVYFDVTGSGTATLFLAAYRTVGGVRTLVAAPNYDPVAHRWLRIRESAGSVYWDTSPDQVTWTNIATWVPTFGITALYIQLGAGFYGTEPSPGTAIWDNFNTVASEVHTTVGTASGSASATASTATTRSKTATATGTAAATRTGSSVRTKTATATTTATATGATTAVRTKTGTAAATSTASAATATTRPKTGTAQATATATRTTSSTRVTTGTATATATAGGTTSSSSGAVSSGTASATASASGTTTTTRVKTATATATASSSAATSTTRTRTATAPATASATATTTSGRTTTRTAAATAGATSSTATTRSKTGVATLTTGATALTTTWRTDAGSATAYATASGLTSQGSGYRDITITVGPGRSRSLTVAGSSRTVTAVASGSRSLTAAGTSRGLAAAGASRTLTAEPLE